MNKVFYFLLLFSLSVSAAHGQEANDIDLLKTDADVIKFWATHVAEKPKHLSLLPYHNAPARVNDSLKANSWVKTDFNQDGETDLLIFRIDGITQLLFVFAHQGKYKIIRPAYSDTQKMQFVYPIIKKINKINTVLLYSQHQTGADDVYGNTIYTKPSCDTLLYKYGHVVNYSTHPHKLSVDQIFIENNGHCEGECPKVTIRINAEHLTAIGSKQEDWSNKLYYGSLQKSDVQKIISLLHYADFTALRPKYMVRESDQTTTTLTIIYNGGRQKIIKDYGSTGTFTLAAIYEIAANIKWLPKR